MQKIFNLGCKLNQYEGFCLLKKYTNTDNLVIINTCCVTKEAEIKSLKKYRYAIKNYPQCKIIATGCLCRLSPEKFAQAHQVIDNVQRNDIIEDVLPEPKRARFFLKIQDGCNGICTYCIVSRIRQKLESKPIEKILKEISWAKSLGYKEIVLVGANIGLYGFDVGLNLIDLLKTLSTIRDLPRVRLSSIEPRFIHSEFVRIIKDLPICHHFHIPIQSADNNILSRMRRGYDNAFLSGIIDLISKNFNDVAIGGDIIVGFPGEQETEFINTYRFIDSNPFTHLHIFPYSPRPNTEAYGLGDPVTRAEKRQRLWQLKKNIEEKNYQFRQHLLNRRFSIILEKNGAVFSGLTDNYIRVTIDGGYDANRLLEVRITNITKDKTYGDVMSTELNN